MPQLFVGDGAQATSQPARYPWTMGFLQSYLGEGAVYGRNLVKTRKAAKIGVLFQNDDLGKDMTRGLERAIAGKGPQVVAKASYEYTDTDVSSQIAALKAAGADTFMLFATPKFAIQGFAAANRLGLEATGLRRVRLDRAEHHGDRPPERPQLTKGALSVAFVKNPNDPIWAKDPALKLYRTIMKRYLPRGKPSDVYNWYGMTVAWTMVETLERAGQEPDAGEPPPGRADPQPVEQSLPAARDRAEDVQNTLFPARQGLPLPLRQPAVGEGEPAPRRPRVTCHPSFTTWGEPNR